MFPNTVFFRVSGNIAFNPGILCRVNESINFLYVYPGSMASTPAAANNAAAGVLTGSSMATPASAVLGFKMGDMGIGLGYVFSYVGGESFTKNDTGVETLGIKSYYGTHRLMPGLSMKMGTMQIDAYLAATVQLLENYSRANKTNYTTQTALNNMFGNLGLGVQASLNLSPDMMFAVRGTFTHTDTGSITKTPLTTNKTSTYGDIYSVTAGLKYHDQVRTRRCDEFLLRFGIRIVRL